jgi:hypothetical protein
MPSSGVLVEHECPRCHREVTLPFGELCDACRTELATRARRIARWVALGSTVLVALYVLWRVPAQPTLRLMGAVAIVVWYLLSRRVAYRVAREWLS